MMSRDTRVPEHLVERLSDPSDIFPLVHALQALGKVIEEFNDTLYSRYEDVAPKYRDVGLEQGLEAVSIIIGAGFVAAQSILASTFSNVKRLSELDGVRLAGGAGLPVAKRELFQIAAYDRNGVPDIIGINALANYFKHASEWSHDWNGLTRSLEIETARTVSAMGLCPGDPDNMFRGAAALALGGRDGLSKLATRMQEWRESIEAEIKSRLIDADLLS
ncbi:MAG TPA: hypothetical protein VE977_17855 [Pyrinomonadaceae bacterium]|nr:hypothetical protein [Pyrinomonadaceae bacterium]